MFTYFAFYIWHIYHVVGISIFTIEPIPFNESILSALPKYSALQAQQNGGVLLALRES
jgi:hypothetical protein